jgi:hypothetical protein
MKDNAKSFVKLISFIQSSLNNASNAFIELFSNELLYEFKIAKSLNLLKRFDDDNLTTSIEIEREIFKKKVEKTIIFANAFMKIKYDSIKTSFDLKIKNFVYLKLHKKYTQFELFNRKFFKQRLEFVKILEKINKLIYKLKILSTWKIHLVVSIVHLKLASTENDFYERESIESNFVENAQNNTKDIYEIKKIVIKRSIKVERTRHSKIQYRVKWTEWDSYHNQWIDVVNMKDAMNLVREFEVKINENNQQQWTETSSSSSSSNIESLHYHH